MTRYACRNTTCPLRAPVAADAPPTCYTCGAPMSIDLDLAASLAEAISADAIRGTFGGPAALLAPLVDACPSCPHTECSCDCTTCEAAHATKRPPCPCRSCTTLRMRTAPVDWMSETSGERIVNGAVWQETAGGLGFDPD